MKKITIFTVVALFAVILTSCKETKIQNVTMKNSADSLSYAIGMNIGKSFKQDKITDINTDLMADVIKAMITDDTLGLKFNDSTLRVFFDAYVQKKQEQDIAEKKAEEQTWLDEMGKKSGVTKTASGLQYQVLASGNGATPVPGDSVTIHFTGKLKDGTVFESTLNNGVPLTHPVNEFIGGWAEALQLMKEGDKWIVYVPSQLAYGPQGIQGVIPPNSPLEFEMELIKVIPPVKK